ncbi:MAG: type II toxin-antitoxin system RelE/ParE family toxin [Syntrophobacterales bacterium]|nr:type II toxin-antitoxin system RelE/ParE family toxin [Syntrophobacterales bacterium]
MYEVILHKHAAKFYRNAAASLKERIATAFDLISQGPHHHPHIKKLKGELKNMYRFRVGDLRIIYEIEEDIRGNRGRS